MSGSQSQSNSKVLHPLNTIYMKEEEDACNSQYYHNSLSYTQQLDSLLDQYEIKYGLGACASENMNATCSNNGENQNLSRSSVLLRMTTSLASNKGVDKETDMRLWEMAKRIKKRNESYRTVAKILRELHAASKAPVTKKPFDDPPTTSCSSEESCNDEVDQNQEIEKARGNIKSKSAMVAKQTTTATTTRTSTNPVAPGVTRTPIVMTKSEMTVPNPVKNPKLPSRAIESLQKYGIPRIIPRPSSSSSFTATHGHDQPSVHKRTRPTAEVQSDVNHEGDAGVEDEAKNNVMTLLSNLLDHSTAMVMNLLNYSQEEVDPQQGDHPQNYLNNSKQQFQIGSVLGAPYIPGIRTLPPIAVIKTPR